MEERIVQNRSGLKPLPVRDGLNPSRVPVTKATAGMTAWDFLSEVLEQQRYRHPLDDASYLQQRFDAGEVVRGTGIPLTPGSVLLESEAVWFYRVPAPEVPVPGEITTIYEDDNILVVDKPHYLATMPRGRHITETATVRLRRATGNNDLAPAHRLDRATAGVLLLTKRKEVRGAYQELFAHREVTKVYHALARWSPELASQAPVDWHDRIEKVPGELQAYFDEGPHNAHTTLANVRLLPDDEQQSLRGIHHHKEALGEYELHPTTGRTHQLRIQMNKAGVPILGDQVYPNVQAVEAEDFNVPLRLVARCLAFRDPITGQQREFVSPRTWV